MIIENNVAHNVDVCFALDFVQDTFTSSDAISLHSNICSEPLNYGLELQDGIFRGTISLKDNAFVSQQHDTSNLMQIQKLSDTPANIPSGNVFFCPNCDAVAIYNGLTYFENNIDQLGSANHYATISSKFDQTGPSLTVNDTVYTGGSGHSTDDPKADIPNTDETALTNMLILEVENYDQYEGSFELRTSTDASGDAYMVVPKSVGSDYDGDGDPLAKLHYDIRMKPGTYFLWIRTFGLNSGSDSFHVFIDQIKQKTFHTHRGDWTWKRLSNALQLDGVHQLTLALRESETRGDKMVITDDPHFTPTGFGPEPDEIADDSASNEPSNLFVAEAEHYDDLEGAFTEGFSADASQTTYMVVPGATGSDVDGDGDPLAKLHYDINMTPGDYNVWIRAFGQHSAADSLFVSFDAGDNKALHVTTDGFQWYRVRRMYNLHGNHTFTISLREANTFVDKIIITDDLEFTPVDFGPDLK